MTSLICPFCGPRKLAEFEFRMTLPEPHADPCARIYERVDHDEVSLEHWQHVGGCRAWLRVRRNPWTGVVSDVLLLGSVAL
jgi:methylglutamate dehydrogenase subunit B